MTAVMSCLRKRCSKAAAMMRDATKDVDSHTSAWGRDYLMMEFENIKTK